MKRQLSFDYNLLRPLRALLEEGSVSRAAERMHVSQPTMSVALSRLRTYFADPLLVRKGNRHDLTLLGTKLLAALPVLFGDIDRVLQLKSEFDPATSARLFVIAGVDHAISQLAPVLTKIVLEEAPGIRFEFPAIEGRLVDSAPDSLRGLDGVILPHGYFTDQPYLDIMQDEWVCVVDANSRLGDEPTSSELLMRQWVYTLATREGMTPARRQLQIRGLDVEVAAVTPYFHVVPDLIDGTDRVALLPRRLAERVIREGRVRIVASPFDLDPIRDAFWWHQDREHDADHAWLRSVLERAQIAISNSNSHH